MSLAVDNKDGDAEMKALVDSSVDLIEIDDSKVDENDILHQGSILFLVITYVKVYKRSLMFVVECNIISMICFFIMLYLRIKD